MRNAVKKVVASVKQIDYNTSEVICMDDKKMDAIRSRVKSRRAELGFSLQDVADRTGISKSTLQRYETGSIKNLPLDKLDILATALETTPQSLMGCTIKEDAEWMALVDSGLMESNSEETYKKEIHNYKILTLQRLLALRGCTINRSIRNVYFVDGICNGGILQDEEATHIVDEVANYTEYLITQLFSNHPNSNT